MAPRGIILLSMILTWFHSTPVIARRFSENEFFSFSGRVPNIIAKPSCNSQPGYVHNNVIEMPHGCCEAPLLLPQPFAPSPLTTTPHQIVALSSTTMRGPTSTESPTTLTTETTSSTTNSISPSTSQVLTTTSPATKQTAQPTTISTTTPITTPTATPSLPTTETPYSLISTSSTTDSNLCEKPSFEEQNKAKQIKLALPNRIGSARHECEKPLIAYPIIRPLSGCNSHGHIILKKQSASSFWIPLLSEMNGDR
ncbi:integumentary mucin C.1-like [Toxorhynchites rutilus septentrionalis]|uniref:integumentary mucin C.1-like n=1 Tax=Toxorhynchites rutilus septentrionalis TaxID=329112 RepID=UPI002478FFCF|nr:integumentary mucin C.1-like [Toxorhynchites rutilus septentrionalis]